ncbi:SCO family protein [Paenibacillus riograndensis]|uniref:Electron transport protein SCO1/SenC n=1 Tax=Paenibacillus riograndensis SBR5 TaxID=1073571 RepID=A0A0E4CZ03_9BACL|nr:SCO family protein [Paenibacillus riograndensis]CQR58055.1 electron transport protein SCO1/SenC [Paenibacillus riograndensis SBR5]
MQTLKRYKWTWLMLLVALGLAVYLAFGYWNKGNDKLPVIGEVQDFSLENVDGRPITLADTEGKPRLVYFFFTECPDVCPITTFMLSQTQDLLKKDGSFGKDVEFVSISFDPLNDTREAIKAFADRFHADYSGWYFLRGDQEQVRTLAADSFKVLIYGDNKDNFAHANLIGLVDRNNRLRGLYDAGDTENVTPEFLAGALKKLARES